MLASNKLWEQVSGGHVMRCLAVVAELLAEPRVHGARVSHEADLSKKCDYLFCFKLFLHKVAQDQCDRIGRFFKKFLDESFLQK